MPKDYETLFIIKADLSDEDIKKEVDAITKIAEADGGSIISLDLWGKKRLAYSIKKQRYGFYTLLRFSAAPTTPENLNRHYRFNENILKGMVILFDGAAGRKSESDLLAESQAQRQADEKTGKAEAVADEIKTDTNKEPADGKPE